nr:hypothetical protein [Escherichia coli]
MIKARQENAQAIKEENVDCSYLPRPAICEVGSTYVDPITGKEIPKILKRGCKAPFVILISEFFSGNPF